MIRAPEPLTSRAACQPNEQSCSLRAIYRRTASYADNILHSADPGIYQSSNPPAFELLINLKTADAFGLQNPAHPSILADKVIEWRIILAFRLQ
jgi:hypothetical protein